MIRIVTFFLFQVFILNLLYAQTWKHYSIPLKNHGDKMTMDDSLIYIEPFGLIYDLNGNIQPGNFHEPGSPPINNNGVILDSNLYLKQKHGHRKVVKAPVEKGNIVMDSKGNVYVLVDDKLWKYNDTTWTAFKLNLDIPIVGNDEPILFDEYTRRYDLVIDKTDIIWANLYIPVPVGDFWQLYHHIYIDLNTLKYGFRKPYDDLPYVDKDNSKLFLNLDTLYVIHPTVIDSITGKIHKSKVSFIEGYAPDSTVIFSKDTNLYYRYGTEWVKIDDRERIKINYLKKSGFLDKNRHLWHYKNFNLYRNTWTKIDSFQVFNPNDTMNQCFQNIIKDHLNDFGFYREQINGFASLWLDINDEVKYYKLRPNSDDPITNLYNQYYFIDLENCHDDTDGYKKMDGVKDPSGNIWFMAGPQPKSPYEDYTRDSSVVMRYLGGNVQKMFVYKDALKPLAKLFFIDKDGILWAKYFANRIQTSGSRGGAIYSYTSSGLISFDGAAWIDYGYLSDQIISCIQGNNGEIWVLTSDKLLKKTDNNEWVTYDLPIKNKLSNMFKSKNGNILFCVRENGYLTQIYEFNGKYWFVNQLPDEVMNITPDLVHGLLWVSGKYGISYSKDGKEWIHFNVGTELPYGPVLNVLVDKRGDVWIETDKVISQLKIDDSMVSIVDENLVEAKALVYPNPVDDILTLNIHPEGCVAHLFTVDGLRIKSVENTSQIDVTDFPNGYYVIQIIDKNRVKVLSFVKK